MIYIVHASVLNLKFLQEVHYIENIIKPINLFVIALQIIVKYLLIIRFYHVHFFIL